MMSRVKRVLLCGMCLGLVCPGALLIVSRDQSPGPTVATVPVGMYPSVVIVAGNTKRALVLNTYDTTVSVLDEATGRVVATTRVGSNGGAHPQQAAVDESAGHAFVLTDDGEVTMLDARTGQRLRDLVVGGSPEAIAVDAGTARAFVTDVDAGTVSVVDTRTDRLLHTVTVGRFPVTVACSSRTGYVFVANEGDSTISVLNARSGRPVRRVQLGDAPISLAISDRFKELYVAGVHGSVAGVDLQTGAIRFQRTLLRPAATNSGLQVLADDPAGAALVAVGSRLFEINPRSSTPLRVLTLSSRIAALTADPRSGTTIVVLRGRSNTPGQLAGNGSVVAISARGSVVKSVSAGFNPSAIALDDRAGRVFMANTNLNPDGSVPQPQPTPSNSLTALGHWLSRWLPSLSPTARPPSTGGSVTVLRLSEL